MTDGKGRITAALWPGPGGPDAPTRVGVVLSDGQEAYEVDLPAALDGPEEVDFSQFTVRTDATGTATLVPAG
ncbi:hypothetical protein JNUCC64_01490 [Streptomyces sp. JNUCC 64]